MSEWLSCDIFAGGFTPPAPPFLPNYFDNAEHSILTPCGCSNFDRYEREMQSVTASKNMNVAFDWTFQAIKTATHLAPRRSSLVTRVQRRRSLLWP
jgi:hypothetical protein